MVFFPQEIDCLNRIWQNCFRQFCIYIPLCPPTSFLCFQQLIRALQGSIIYTKCAFCEPYHYPDNFDRCFRQVTDNNCLKKKTSKCYIFLPEIDNLLCWLYFDKASTYILHMESFLFVTFKGHTNNKTNTWYTLYIQIKITFYIFFLNKINYFLRGKKKFKSLNNFLFSVYWYFSKVNIKLLLKKTRFKRYK